MYLNEIDEVQNFLNKEIEKEEKYMSTKNYIFFKKNKLSPYKIIECNAIKGNEYCFLILVFNNKGIFFDDIESDFGLCNVKLQNKCSDFRVFDGTLNGVLEKLSISSLVITSSKR